MSGQAHSGASLKGERGARRGGEANQLTAMVMTARHTDLDGRPLYALDSMHRELRTVCDVCLYTRSSATVLADFLENVRVVADSR